MSNATLLGLWVDRGRADRLGHRRLERTTPVPESPPAPAWSSVWVDDRWRAWAQRIDVAAVPPPSGRRLRVAIAAVRHLHLPHGHIRPGH